MYIEMVVGGLTIDPLTNSPVLILKDLKGEQTLPIWIGVLEATSIATVLEKIDVGRPMTHDLLNTIVSDLGARILRVEICDLRDNTYYALLHLDQKGACIQIDSRPSDAIAIALRCGAPIFVLDTVLEKSKREVENDKEVKEGIKVTSTEDKEKLKEILEELNPEDFGKYKM
ncbi:MAG: bifunctional nuclease family protein [Deltaproteobacteria bacterium]|nr:MAG: bifunctional nuclease family protein [Deltaproteobacteria bacterium]